MNRSLAITAIAIANVLGGLSYLWQKLAVECGVPEATLTGGRNLVAGVILFCWIRRRRRFSWSYTLREWLRLGAIGIFGFGLPLVLGVVGLQRSTTGNASILVLLEPTAITLFSWLLLGEHIAARQLVALCCGLVGAYAVVVGEFGSGLLAGLVGDDEHFTGNVILAVHGVLWGLYSPLMKPLATRHAAADLTLAVMLLGMIPILPAALAEAPRWSGIHAPWQALGYTICLGVLVSLLGTFLWNYSLRALRASTVAGFVFIQPLVGCLTGALFLGEELTAGAVAGGALIGLAVILVSRGGRGRARAARADGGVPSAQGRPRPAAGGDRES